MEKFLEYPNIDFGKRYIVTSDGEIISTSTNAPLRYAFNYNGDLYKRVVLTDEFHRKHLLYVHRIVAFNFIPNPNNYKLINHKDEDPSNNNASNLEWCDATYNNTYNNLHIKNGLRIKGRTAYNKNTTSNKYKDKEILMIDKEGRILNVFDTMGLASDYISDLYNEKRSIVYKRIYDALNRGRNTYLGYIWQWRDKSERSIA